MTYIIYFFTIKENIATVINTAKVKPNLFSCQFLLLKVVDKPIRIMVAACFIDVFYLQVVQSIKWIRNFLIFQHSCQHSSGHNSWLPFTETKAVFRNLLARRFYLSNWSTFPIGVEFFYWSGPTIRQDQQAEEQNYS